MILKALAIKYEFVYPEDKLIHLTQEVNEEVDDNAKYTDVFKNKNLLKICKSGGFQFIIFYLLYLLKSNSELNLVQEFYLDVDREDRKYIKWIAGKNGHRNLLLKLIKLDRSNNTN